MQDIEKNIRERAYHLWLESGCQDGSADAHWLEAQREILSASLGDLGRVPCRRKSGRLKTKVTTTPNHSERQLMQRLRGRGWVSAVELSSTPAVVKRLLERCWIEREGTGMSTTFGLTEDGLAAKRAPIPLQR
jgi:hypothetical protein